MHDSNGHILVMRSTWNASIYLIDCNYYTMLPMMSVVLPLIKVVVAVGMVLLHVGGEGSGEGHPCCAVVVAMMWHGHCYTFGVSCCCNRRLWCVWLCQSGGGHWHWLSDGGGSPWKLASNCNSVGSVRLSKNGGVAVIFVMLRSWT